MDDPGPLGPPKLVKMPVTPQGDSTECNYLIMFWVLGMFILVLTD